jgi:murein DD-endopeptidase MepM/ murein hydrolase activator NlpD
LPADAYKKLENRLFQRIGAMAKRVSFSILKALRTVLALGRQRFTVMLIPHSERRIFNFHINIFSLVFALGLSSALAVGFFILSARSSGTQRALDEHSRNWENAQATMETIREEIAELQKVSRVFQNTLNTTMGVLGINVPERSPLSPGEGDFASFLGMAEVEAGRIRELHDIQNVKALLNGSIGPLNEIRTVLSTQKNFLVDIPTLWPVKGVRGRITQNFGFAEHPFFYNWYIHKGIDIAYGYNVPIVATARGKVVTVDWEPMGFGNYVVIRHKYGFYTKYAHLQKILVSRGQEVQQGQVIGTMGSTGLSTGPHLHYEVRIGSEVVDPAKYLNITNSAADLQE